MSNSAPLGVAFAELLGASPSPIAEAEPSSECGIGVQSLLDDHSELRDLVIRLRRLCLALRSSRKRADSEAAALIEEFAYLSIAHFAAEQASEFFESRLAGQPRMLERVERLQAEHDEIAAALGEVLEFCRSSPSGPELASCLTRVLDMFDAHERGERAFIRELLRRDEGGGDE
jgi:hypothetical protein